MSGIRSGDTLPLRVSGTEAARIKNPGDLIFIPTTYNGLGEKALISGNPQLKLQIWNELKKCFEEVPPIKFSETVKREERLVIPNGIKAVISPAPFVQIEVHPISYSNLSEGKDIGLLVKYNEEPEESNILLSFNERPSIDLRGVGTFMLVAKPPTSIIATTQSK